MVINESPHQKQKEVFAFDLGIWDDIAFKPEPFTEREAWLWMLSKAACENQKTWKGYCFVNLRRGEFCYSLGFLADKWNWTRSKVSGFFKRLEKIQMISLKSENSFKLITICNYEKYQRIALPFRILSPASEDISQTVETQQNSELDTEAKFEVFWKEFPSQGKSEKQKLPAFERFKLAIKNGANPDHVIFGAKSYASHLRRKTQFRGNGNFTTQASKWLHENSWNDFQDSNDPQSDFSNELTQREQWEVKAELFIKNRSWAAGFGNIHEMPDDLKLRIPFELWQKTTGRPRLIVIHNQPE